ncbi:MAG: hypothetical protein U1E19_14220 [Rhodoblastus sp.]
MSLRRLAIGAVLLFALAVGVIAATPPGRLALYYLLRDSDRIDWEDKAAFARCAGALAGRSKWPEKTSKACQAYSMCANEAQLSRSEYARLEEIGRAAGCPP